MYEIPTTIEIDGNEFPIRCKGDYRMVLDCFSCLNDLELTEQERVFGALEIFYEDFDDIEDFRGMSEDLMKSLVMEMYKFMECNENPMHSMPYKTIDWEKDGQIIFSAVNKVAHTEIRSVKYLHWWTFIGYFCEVGESVLSVVVTIRNKIKQNKKLEKYEKEFKARNPHYFIWDSRTTEQKQDEEDILSMWNQDKGVPNG
jgi:hypothetical protein